MNYKTMDIIKSRININSLIKNITECKDFLENDYLINMDKNIWNAKSKKNFIFNLQILDNESKDLLNILNQSLLSLDKIQDIQKKFSVVESLEEENKILQNSMIQTDQIKLMQNLNEIDNLKNEISIIKTNLINEWSK